MRTLLLTLFALCLPLLGGRAQLFDPVDARARLVAVFADIDEPHLRPDTARGIPIGLIPTLLERGLAFDTGQGVVLQKTHQVGIGAHRDAAEWGHAYHFQVLLGIHIPIKTGNC